MLVQKVTLGIADSPSYIVYDALVLDQVFKDIKDDYHLDELNIFRVPR